MNERSAFEDQEEEVKGKEEEVKGKEEGELPLQEAAEHEQT